jgi:hypothetical protein
MRYISQLGLLLRLAMPDDNLELSADLRLDRSPKSKYLFSLPVALSQRLDELVTCVHAVGGTANRGEVVAAAIMATDLDGSHLDGLLHDYRVATVGDLKIEGGGPNVVRLPMRRRPGPRRR